MGEFSGEGARLEIYRASKEVVKMAKALAKHVEELDTSKPTVDDVNDMLYAEEELESIFANYFGIRRDEI
jgi:uncharacterized protein Yka (UPF0111/DUF47 family)